MKTTTKAKPKKQLSTNQQFGLLVVWGLDEFDGICPAIYQGWWRLSSDEASIEYRKLHGRNWLRFCDANEKHDFMQEVKK